MLAFSALGLVKGTFLAAEAVSSLVPDRSKLLMLPTFGTLTAGAFIGKAFVLRMSPAVLQRLPDALLLLSSLASNSTPL